MRELLLIAMVALAFAFSALPREHFNTDDLYQIVELEKEAESTSDYWKKLFT